MTRTPARQPVAGRPVTPARRGRTIARWIGVAGLLAAARAGAQPVTQAPSAADAPAAACDPELSQRARGAYGYARRGDRCEGVYVRQVAGTVLAMASLTQAFADYDPDSTAKLALAWTAPGDGPVHLRVRGIRRDLYYAMDAVRPPGSRGYDWPTNILASQRIRRADIGVVGWTRAVVGGVERTVYLPLRVAPARPGAAAGSGGYEVVLYPNVRLDEVFVTLTALEPGGRVRATIKRNEPLGLGYYPAERPLKVRLANPGAPGLYQLEIAARAVGGAAVTIEPVLFHHGAP